MQLLFNAQSAGYNHTLDFHHENPDEMIRLHDVAFGDLWVCSGQSNMQFPMAYMFKAEQEIQNIIDTVPELRMMMVQYPTESVLYQLW